jgi:bacterial/archaeal transporter family-2 protein
VSKEVAVLVTVAAGGFVAAQAPANNVLSKSLGTFGAASVNFLMGTACVLIITFAFAGGFAGDEGAATPPWYYWLLGGLAGWRSWSPPWSPCASWAPAA